MVNFNGYSRPESNNHSTDPDDTIGMGQVNNQKSFDTNPYFQPENGDKKPSLAKKIIIGGTAVALAVAVGVGVNSAQNNKSTSDNSDSEQTAEIPDLTNNSDDEQSITMDTPETDYSSSLAPTPDAAPTAEEDASIYNDGSWIINYSVESSIPDLDSYNNYGAITTEKLNRRALDTNNCTFEECMSEDPMAASYTLSNSVDSNGYDRVVPGTAHDGETSKIYPAVSSVSRSGSIKTYILVKSVGDYEIIAVDNSAESYDTKYLKFESDFIPEGEMLDELYQNNQDLVQTVSDDDYFNSNGAIDY